MADAVATSLQIRLSRHDKQRLLRAFLISLAVHLLLFGAYKLARHFQWQPDVLLPHWLKLSRNLEQAIAAKKEAMANPEPPLVFVHVNPAQAATDAPPDTKYYSDRSSRAANPEADRDTNIPKIAGTQEQIVKTEDTQRNPFDRLQPALPVESAPPQEEAKAKATQPPGDLTLAKAEDVARKSDGTEARPRVRTLAAARARQENSPPGQKMKQEGGVKRRLDFAGLDVSESPIGRYDRALVDAVSERWYDLLEAKRYDGYQRGKVVLQFALNSDGRITDMKVQESSVALDLSLLCEMAVLDPAPYAPWPTEMRHMINGNKRTVTFTFYYN